MEKKKTGRTRAAKTTAKAAAEKAVEVTVAAAEKVSETAAEVAEKVSAADLPAKAEKAVEKAAEKVPAKKTTARRTAVKETVYLQYMGKEINQNDIIEEVKKIWTEQLGKKASEMKTLAVYLKPEENTAYYVINDEVRGSVQI
ncbi:MAG TPA: hypothetical protein IAB44_03325 [Candidatus Limivivens intestinipullorum]|uniref:Uncharacterized protein n=1 Tax=Candidatus Limivivens intestinipullorum TaxID=2840858 RepID=A0A9D1ERL7_9FIRM|nr:hypothetical protein [Candidatus Limivivens intestinipullorum]